MCAGLWSIAIGIQYLKPVLGTRAGYCDPKNVLRYIAISKKVFGYITIMSDFQINQCYMAFSNTSSSRSTMRLILTDKVVNAKVSFQI